MRTFIAIEINKVIQDEIEIVQKELESLDLDAKMADVNNIHLTLKFLGETETGKIENIKNILNKICEGAAAFSMQCCGLGVFPSLPKARVVWIGINKGKEQVINLADNIDNETEKLGFKKELRSFTPHITIARLKSSQNIHKIESKLEKFGNKEFGDITVDKIDLIKSTLTIHGPIYELLSSHYLKN